MTEEEPFQALATYERKVYSQNGEDGVIEELFKRIGTDSRFAVEFGVEDGQECNTRLLKEQGWQVLQMDGQANNSSTGIKREIITAENINEIFHKHKVPENLDFLCIDIDSNDFYVWKALSDEYKPRLLMIEYNASFAPCHSRAVVYDPKLLWDGTQYFGASLLAMYRLAKKKGYDLVYCNQNGVNAFFVRVDCMKNLEPKTPVEVYRGPAYGQLDAQGVWIGHKPTSRQFVEIDTDLNIIPLPDGPKSFYHLLRKLTPGVR